MALHFHLDELKSLSLIALADNELVRLIHQLSEGLTSKRDQYLESYTLSEEIVSAYASFYLPTNFPKFRFLMEQLPAPLIDQLSRCHWVDWCTGPGTYLLAMLDYFTTLPKLTGIDRSQVMLLQARKMLDFFYPHPAQTISLSTELEKNTSTPSCFLWGNGVNEMGVEQVWDIVNKYQPDFLIFIEPGTKQVYAQMMELRTRLLQGNYRIQYPCLSEAPCPMLALPSQADWCHQVLKTTHDPSIERISQLARLDRRSLPMIGQVYAKAAWGQHKSTLNEATFLARLIRKGKENKHAIMWQGCLVNSTAQYNNDSVKDPAHELIWLEIPKKHLSKASIKTLTQQSVGLTLTFKLLKAINTSTWRVAPLDF